MCKLVSLCVDGLSVDNCWKPTQNQALSRATLRFFLELIFWLLLEMTALCQHLDDRWLTEACAGKDARSTMEDVKRFSAASWRNRSSVF